MPRKGAKNLIPLFVELSPELDGRLRDYCKERGARIADEVRMAIRRHLDYPPAESPPLPDGPAPGPAKRRK